MGIIIGLVITGLIIWLLVKICFKLAIPFVIFICIVANLYHFYPETIGRYSEPIFRFLGII